MAPGYALRNGRAIRPFYRADIRRQKRTKNGSDRAHGPRTQRSAPLSSKAISVMGTFLFGAVIALTGSSRLAMVNLLILFAMDLVLFPKVDIAQGIQERKSDGG